MFAFFRRAQPKRDNIDRGADAASRTSRNRAVADGTVERRIRYQAYARRTYFIQRSSVSREYKLKKGKMKRLFCQLQGCAFRIPQTFTFNRVHAVGGGRQAGVLVHASGGRVLRNVSFEGK